MTELTIERIYQMAKATADDAVAEVLARHAAPAETEAAIPELERLQLHACITEYALLHGVRPNSVRHILRDSEDVFAVKDGAVVPRHSQTDPSDPLSPLTPARWLEQLAKTEGNLFAEPGEPQ